MKPLTVGIVGAGLIGARRAEIVSADPIARLIAVSDVNADRAKAVAGKLGCEFISNGMNLSQRTDIDVVIVATSHKFLPVYSQAALDAGKHVLCEKPMGRNAQEVRQLVETARRKKVVLKAGFNHRYHSAIQSAHELLTRGIPGKMMFLRCRYGHGGRPGYDKEWRGNPDLAGGGELLDQGIHVLDLFRWFAGDFTEVFGWTSTRIWDIAPLEDNAMALLRTKTGVQAFVHASWTQWKNLFSFEIFGQEGYLIVEGLGGSYGTERLTVGRRRPESGPPDEEKFEFPGPDESWVAEWKDFSGAIREGRPPWGTGEDGLEAIRLVDAIYRSSGENRPVQL